MGGSAGLGSRRGVVALVAACLALTWAEPPSRADAPTRHRSSCFGAAARDPARPGCRTAEPKGSIVPAPSVANRLPNAPCALVAPAEPPPVWAFGVPPGHPAGPTALVGDSHAGHWRAALDVVARARRWRGLSLTHTSCPLSTAVRDLPDPARFRACVRWKRQLFAW